MDLPKARFLTYEQVASIAEEFLSEHGAGDKIPINIEWIAESGLKLEIIPIPGIEIALDTVGWLALNYQSIYVDQDVMLTNPSRYRFTLAHEIGHLVMHGDEFHPLSKYVQTAEDWYKIHLEMDKWFEDQADWFAGTMLVPEVHLLAEYRKMLSLVYNEGVDETELSEYSHSVIAGRIAKVFQVSTPVVEIRLRKLGL